MEKSLLTEVKAILKSLVVSCPDKITIDQLNRDYRDVEGQFIPFRQLGYGNIEVFLRSIPDTLRVFGSGPTAMVCFVANEKSDHIHDMIMKQKKPKSKTRSRSKSLSRSKNHGFQRSNRLNTDSYQPPKMVGQQLSPYESVNRNHMTKTIQVRNTPILPMPTPVPSLQVLYSLPQPSGILLNTHQCINYTYNPVLSSLRNGLIKPVVNKTQQFEKQVSHVSDLMRKQCNVSDPTPSPPPLPRPQSRNVKFASARSSSVQIEEKSQQDSLKVESNEIKKSEESLTKSKILSNVIKTPKAKKQFHNKLSDEVESLLSMPKLSKVSNPIEESSTVELYQEENLQNTKSVNETKILQPKRFFDDSTDRVVDPDEAVPSFAAKNNVFRLDFPEHTVPFGSKIASYKLSDEVAVGSCIKIFISEIHNPFKFWFHIYKDNHELDLLMYQIERYYSTFDTEDLRIPMMCLIPGQVCAARYNGLWHRAEIVTPPVNTNIKVSFLDYGTVSEVEIENIKFLATFFAQLPAQALRGCLSHIKPRSLHWSHDATTYFLRLVAELMLYAKITEIDREKNILYMILCDTNGDEVVQVNKSLVEHRYAVYNDDWKTEKIKQNNGQRIHHPREDFPTFSMIESGEYPSFPELVSLQQRGIDYEAIYDLVLYNQSSILNKHESASEHLRNLPYFLTTSNPFRSEILLELYTSTSKVI